MVMESVLKVCRFRGWSAHAVHVRSNNIHAVISCICQSLKGWPHIDVSGPLIWNGINPSKIKGKSAVSVTREFAGRQKTSIVSISGLVALRFQPLVLKRTRFEIIFVFNNA